MMKGITTKSRQCRRLSRQTEQKVREVAQYIEESEVENNLYLHLILTNISSSLLRNVSMMILERGVASRDFLDAASLVQESFEVALLCSDRTKMV